MTTAVVQMRDGGGLEPKLRLLPFYNRFPHRLLHFLRVQACFLSWFLSWPSVLVLVSPEADPLLRTFMQLLYGK